MCSLLLKVVGIRACPEQEDRKVVKRVKVCCMSRLWLWLDGIVTDGLLDDDCAVWQSGLTCHLPFVILDLTVRYMRVGSLDFHQSGLDWFESKLSSWRGFMTLYWSVYNINIRAFVRNFDSIVVRQIMSCTNNFCLVGSWRCWVLLLGALQRECECREELKDWHASLTVILIRCTVLLSWSVWSVQQNGSRAAHLNPSARSESWLNG